LKNGCKFGIGWKAEEEEEEEEEEEDAKPGPKKLCWVVRNRTADMKHFSERAKRSLHS
jgi:hypothetical protein